MRSPFGSALRSDSAAANSPFTIASRTAPGTFTESMSEAACLKLPCAGANFASAIGAMLVKRQSSLPGRREADLREPPRGVLAPLLDPGRGLHERFHHFLAPAGSAQLP